MKELLFFIVTFCLGFAFGRTFGWREEEAQCTIFDHNIDDIWDDCEGYYTDNE